MNTVIVDDNRSVLKSVSKILLGIDPGGTHMTADSGPAAMDCIRRNPPDVVFLDIEMPGGSGMDVAAHLRSISPETNVIFITGHSEYAMQAFELYASGYLLKPITEEKVRTALENLRHPVAWKRAQTSALLSVQCFGDFEAWFGGMPVRFGRSRSKMLLAYLISRNGAMCDTGQMMCALWPEEPDSDSHRNQIRVIISDLQTTLTKLGAGRTLIRQHGRVGINKEQVECDYYDYLRGVPEALRKFQGEYMNQYSFGEETLALLTENRRQGTGL